MFTSSETKQRNAYVDGAIVAATEVLTHPSVVDSIGTTAVSAQLKVLGGMYVPNFRDGIVSIPRRYRKSDATPVVAVHHGDEIVAGEGLGLSPYQQERALQQVEGWKYAGPAEDLAALVDDLHWSNEDKIGRRLFTVFPTNQGFTAGTVSTHAFKREQFPNIGKNPDRSVFGRPVVGLAMPREKGMEYVTTPFTMLHEIEHVRQRQETPIIPETSTDKFKDYKFRSELEAYGSTAIVERALFGSDHPEFGGNMVILTNEQVDAVRRQYATAKDPYAPRGVIRQMLLATDLDIKA